MATQVLRRGGPKNGSKINPKDVDERIAQLRAQHQTEQDEKVSEAKAKVKAKTNGNERRELGEKEEAPPRGPYDPRRGPSLSVDFTDQTIGLFQVLKKGVVRLGRQIEESHVTSVENHPTKRGGRSLASHKVTFDSTRLRDTHHNQLIVRKNDSPSHGAGRSSHGRCAGQKLRPHLHEVGRPQDARRRQPIPKASPCATPRLLFLPSREIVPLIKRKTKAGWLVSEEYMGPVTAQEAELGDLALGPDHSWHQSYRNGSCTDDLPLTGEDASQRLQCLRSLQDQGLLEPLKDCTSYLRSHVASRLVNARLSEEDSLQVPETLQHAVDHGHPQLARRPPRRWTICSLLPRRRQRSEMLRLHSATLVGMPNGDWVAWASLCLGE